MPKATQDVSSPLTAPREVLLWETAISIHPLQGDISKSLFGEDARSGVQQEPLMIRTLVLHAERGAHIIDQIHQLIIGRALANNNARIGRCRVYHSSHLAKALVEVIYIVEDPHGHDGVKTAIRKGESFCTTRVNVDVLVLRLAHQRRVACRVRLDREGFPEPLSYRDGKLCSFH